VLEGEALEGEVLDGAVWSDCGMAEGLDDVLDGLVD
jgi:hypothetical protein